MAYGLKYILRYNTERYGTDFRVLIHEDGYTGDPVKKRIGAGHVKMTKDLDGKIAGSKLEFSIQSDVNFEYQDFFLKENKSFKVQLEFYGTVTFTSYIVNDQYSEPYIAPPYDVEVLCTDGLGLLKNEKFELTGMVSRFDAIRYCIDKIGISLPYAININIWEQNMNPEGHNMLNQIYFNADILSKKTCYEAIQALLPENCRINQANGFWMIERPTDRTLDRYVFNADGTPSEETYNWHTYLRHLGSIEQAKEDHGRLYPIGNLTMEFLPSYKQITIKQDFGKRESFFRNHNFEKGTTNWTESESGFFEVKKYNEQSFALLKGMQTTLTKHISQSIDVISTQPIILKIFYTPVGYWFISMLKNLNPLLVDINIQIKLVGKISAKTYYLDQDGWSEQEKVILVKNARSSVSLNALNFQELNISASKLPETGTITAKIYQRKFSVSNVNPSEDNYIGIAFEKIILYTEDLNSFASEESTDVILSANATESDKTIDLMPVDLPNYENAWLFFDNGNYILKDGKYVPSSKWGATNATYLEYISAYMKYLYGNPRAVLTGEISGWLELNSYIIHDMTGKIYMINTGTWNVIEHTFSLELIELPEGEFSLDEWLPALPDPADPIFDQLNNAIIDDVSDIFYRNSDGALVNKYGLNAVYDANHIVFPELQNDIFNRSDAAYWSGLSIIDGVPRKWPLIELVKNTIQNYGTAATKARLFWNDYVASPTDILPVLNYPTDQANITEIESYVSENQPLIGNHIKTIDGSFDAPIPGTTTPVVVARKQTIDAYKLDHDAGQMQFSLSGALVAVSESDPNSISVEAGKLISHNFYSKSRTEIELMKQASEEYDPTREWTVDATDIILPDNDGYFMYIKVPID